MTTTNKDQSSASKLDELFDDSPSEDEGSVENSPKRASNIDDLDLDTLNGPTIAPNTDPDAIRAIFITDTHLGFAENDPIKGQDSFESFEEALKFAVDYDVDLVLHGGDLFHENRPSKNTEMRCIDIIRKYAFGKKPLKFQFLSPKYKANFHDKNFSVSYPIFAIHGNHDDRAGSKRVSALDVLHTAGLLNLFGSNDNVSLKIHNEPLVISKGKTTLGLYGLGSIRDERLHRQFEDNLVSWDSEGAENRFNIFLIHQNHVKHGATTKFIPETNLPGFLDLVLWGHEHDCYPDPIRNDQRGFAVVQPGSSVATQLTHGEARPKYITMFDIVGKSFKPYKIPLRTVRPFFIEDFFHSLHDIEVDDPRIKDKTINACEKRVRYLLKECKNTATNDKLPLVRLRVDYTKNGHDNFSNIAFGQKFTGLVANPTEIINFTKATKFNKPRKSKIQDPNITIHPLQDNSESNITKSDLIHTILMSNIKKYGGLKLLNTKEFGESLNEFVDKDENHSLNNYVEAQMRQASKVFKTTLNETEELGEPSEFFKNCLLSINSELKDFPIEEIYSTVNGVDLTVDNNNNTTSQNGIQNTNDGDEIVELPASSKKSIAKPRATKAKSQPKSLAPSITRKSKTRQTTLFEIPDI